jgi:hypothetical protein
VAHGLALLHAIQTGYLIEKDTVAKREGDSGLSDTAFGDLFSDNACLSEIESGDK